MAVKAEIFLGSVGRRFNLWVDYLAEGVRCRRSGQSLIVIDARKTD
jgi:hypothetical protein